MTQRKAFLTKEQSLLLRGIAIFLVLISHYAVWIGEIFHSDLLEYGLGRFGVYGVDLFFVVSGYGLVKSVGKKRINGTFLWKRFKTVYLPYLLIVGLITVYDGGISGMTGWVSFLTGAEYWYIRNILVFYLAFYVVYRLSDRSWVRMLLMALCLTAYSGLLIWQGRALFWYISNVTFLFGMLLAQYERQLLKAAGFFVSVTASGTGGRNVFCHQNGAGRLYRDPSAGRKNPQRSACRADLDVSDGAGLRIFA